jgi:putative peptidoglycan lipid II flippase
MRRATSIKEKLKNSRILRRQHISEATLIIASLTLLSKLIGYIRESLVANYFGATAQTDAFDIAMLIPSLIFGLIVAGGLQNIVIPIYIEKRKLNAEKAKIFTNQIFFIASMFLAVLSVLLFIFPEFFIKLVAYGFEGQRLILAAKFTRYLIVFGFFSVFTGLLTGLFQTEKQFLYPALISVLGNMLIPLSLFLLTKRFGINSWTVGEIASSSFTFSALFLFLFFRRGFFKIYNLNNIDWKEIKHFGGLLLPIIFISGLGFINQIVDQTVASTLKTGSIAILNWSQIVYILPVGLLSTSLTTAVYPTFSSLAVEKDFTGYVETFRKTISILAYVMIPISAIFVFLSQPIVKILFQRGAFTQNAAETTAFTVSMYSIGLFIYSANDILTRIFFSFKDTKTPFYRSLVTVGLNIIGNITLSKILGTAGIALSTAISSTVGFFMYTQMLRKRNYIEGLSYKSVIKEIVKVIIASISVVALSYIFKPYILSANGFFHLLARFIIAFIPITLTYILLSFILKLEGFKTLSVYAKSFLNKFKNIKI